MAESATAQLRPTEIVLDRRTNKALQVVAVADQTAEEHPEIDLGDPFRQELGISGEDRVIECVYLHDTADEYVSTPKKTYAFAESQVVRYPVEAAQGDLANRLHTQVLTEFIASVLIANKGEQLPRHAEEFLNAIVDSHGHIDAELPPEELVARGKELAFAAAGEEVTTDD